MRATLTAKPATAISGQRLLECAGFDRRLCASIIVARPDEEQEQLLATIVVDDQRENVACAVRRIRQALGLEVH